MTITQTVAPFRAAPLRSTHQCDISTLQTVTITQTVAIFRPAAVKFHTPMWHLYCTLCRHHTDSHLVTTHSNLPWRYNPFRTLASLWSRLHSSTSSAGLLCPHIPRIYDVSMLMKSFYLLPCFPIAVYYVISHLDPFLTTFLLPFIKYDLSSLVLTAANYSFWPRFTFIYRV